MNILVTGGAGYIGSFMTRRLLDDGHSVVVVDSLVRGHKAYIDSRATFFQGDLLDTNFVKKIFSQNSFDGVIHFAGYISMAESMENPGIYFQNNVYSIITILEHMKKTESNNVIFSSTAGIYGNPSQIPIPEDHLKNPENPYGESKLMAEKILHWYHKIDGINSTCLRYFNACGAALDGSFGEDHDPETHIIPLAMHAALQKKPFSLYGQDYPTKDGTCIRDYIHVLDLIDAHVRALENLQKSSGAHVYNVGTGKGFSNKEILGKVRQITGVDFEITSMPKRAGDAAILIANVTKIKNELGFETKYSDLDTIISSAYKWYTQKK